MTAQIIIPIQPGPSLTQAEIDTFIARQKDVGANADEVLTAMIVAAIRQGGAQEAQAVTPAMAA